MVVFASVHHEHRSLLESIAVAAGTHAIVGAISAGGSSGTRDGEAAASALALRASGMQFAVGAGHEVSEDPLAATKEVLKGFDGCIGAASPMPCNAALLLTDAPAGQADVVVEELTMATGGSYRFFGGSVGDDAAGNAARVFAGTQVFSDAVVALEIRSMHPVGVGVSHGWLPAGDPCRVTEASGSRLISLNGAPAVHTFEEHADATAQTFDRADPTPFFLHNVLGIEEGGEYRLRVPLGIESDGSVLCAASIPNRSVVRIMKTSQASAATAADQAIRAALQELGERRPGAALVFDCVEARLRLGMGSDHEADACAALLAPMRYIGCNTLGQIARLEGRFGQSHNCTAVVCVFPA